MVLRWTLQGWKWHRVLFAATALVSLILVNETDFPALMDC